MADNEEKFVAYNINQGDKERAILIDDGDKSYLLLVLLSDSNGNFETASYELIEQDAEAHQRLVDKFFIYLEKEEE